MADQDLKKIFETAHGADPINAISDQKKSDSDKDIKDIFETAHAADPINSISDQQGQDWSKLQSAGQGVLQGITGGFSDELGGALGAAQEKLAGNPDKKSLEDLYKEYRDMHRARNKAAEESNKGSYLAGNIAGGVGGAVLAPEALAAKATGIGGAAGIGALTGLGTSEAPLGSAQSVKDIATGGLLGAGAGAIGKGISSALSSEALESQAGKAAGRAVGIKPSKELTSIYDPGTGKVLRGSDVTKGIAKTGLEQGALPFTGGPAAIYDSSLDAIDKNYAKLTPLINDAQQTLNTNLPQYLDAAGPLSDKVADFTDDFANQLEKNPDRDAIIKKLNDKYQPYIENMIKSDGDLNQLIQYKKAIQDYATDLSAAAYNQPASDLKPEAEFVKKFGGILRQHIEDLANAANETAGDQIHDVNSTLSNLYSYRDAAKKLMDKPSSSIGTKDVATAGLGAILGGPMGAVLAEGTKLGLEKSTGNTLGRLANIATAKAAKFASEAIKTPAGDLAQKAVVNVPLATVTNPFTQSRVQTSAETPLANTSKISGIATNLYNATGESLKEVADTLTKTPGLSFYGDHLNKAIDSGDAGEKNRAIFLILQNPQSRQLVTPGQELAEDKIRALSESNSRNR